MATETEIPLHAIALWMENNGCKQGHRKEEHPSRIVI